MTEQIWLSLRQATRHTRAFLKQFRNIDAVYGIDHLRKLVKNHAVLGRKIEEYDRWQIEQNSLDEYLRTTAKPHKPHKTHTRELNGKVITVVSSKENK